MQDVLGGSNSVEIFALAEKEVLRLIQTNSYDKFCDTPAYIISQRILKAGKVKAARRACYHFARCAQYVPAVAEKSSKSGRYTAHGWVPVEPSKQLNPKIAPSGRASASPAPPTPSNQMPLGLQISGMNHHSSAVAPVASD